MKIGVFGGTFNPIHIGHLRVAEDVREVLGLSKVLFIPSGNPPLKTHDLVPADHRLEMTRIATRGNPAFEVLDIETSLPGKSYTVDTLGRLNALYEGAELFFMVGIDAFLDIPNWRSPERIISLSNFAVISRPGRRFIELSGSPYVKVRKAMLAAMDGEGGGPVTLPLRGGRTAVLAQVTAMGVSATDIRRRLREGMSVKYLLPPEVESYIISQGLYGKSHVPAMNPKKKEGIPS